MLSNMTQCNQMNELWIYVRKRKYGRAPRASERLDTRNRIKIKTKNHEQTVVHRGNRWTAITAVIDVNLCQAFLRVFLDRLLGDKDA